MIRLLMFLFGKNYEECKSCATLKEQLDFERAEKAQLTQTLLNILQPKVVEAAPVELNSIQQTSSLFSKRRAALEAADRQRAEVIQRSKNLAKPDTVIAKVTDVKEIPIPSDDPVAKLEAELGINEEKGA